jgi:hydrogenase maturation protease
MVGLDAQLAALRGRVGLLCLGGDQAGDDAFGVRLGEQLAAEGVPDVTLAGTQADPLRACGDFRGFDHLIFIDAVDFGGEPGGVVWLDSAEMATRYPQVSTHRLSLGLLAQWVEAQGHTKVWLLGAQVHTARGSALSPPVRSTLAAVKDLLVARLSAGATA